MTDDATQTAIEQAIRDLVSAGTASSADQASERIKSAMKQLTAIAHENADIQEALSDILEAADGGEAAQEYLARGMGAYGRQAP